MLPLTRTLKLAFLDRGLRQIDVAAAIGIDETRLSRIVNGREPPSPRVKAALARLLHKPAAALFPAAPAAPRDRPAA
jgi:transcriptional regulator with XRE-family HTH domain